MILLREIVSDESARSLSRDKYQSKKEYPKVTWLQLFKTLNYFEKNL